MAAEGEIMDINGKEFEVIRLLGKGKGGYSYLVTDGEKQYVLKQIHHEPCAYYTFGDKLASELRDYERLRAMGVPVPQLLDVDPGQERLLKEYIDGDTIDRIILRDEMKPEYYDQIHAICVKIYANRTNIDYYPTNFVVQEGILYYIDYECNDYMEQWDFEHWGHVYWSKTEEFRKAFCS